MARYFCLRFDVDTDLCLRAGLPGLLDLARHTGARFTVFVTPGRAIDRGLALARLLGTGRGGSERAAKSRLGALEKFGPLELVRLIAANPHLLPRRTAVVRTALADGHEIGLHGGRNHGRWQTQAHAWSIERLARELDAGIAALSAATGIPPRSFASPGWNSPPAMPRLLAARGFDTLCDEHGAPDAPHRLDGSGLIAAPTWLAGEPGGVGFLEWHRARGTPDDTIVAEVRRHLETEIDFVCLYDHPFFAGVRELDLLERILEAARVAGRTLAPMGPAARTLVAPATADQ